MGRRWEGRKEVPPRGHGHNSFHWEGVRGRSDVDRSVGNRQFMMVVAALNMIRGLDKELGEGAKALEPKKKNRGKGFGGDGEKS